eukprot:scaffold25563_cov65-Phaeocystis_antarctica.AAC.4
MREGRLSSARGLAEGLAQRQRVPERLRQLKKELARELCKDQRAIDQVLAIGLDIGARLFGRVSDHEQQWASR